MTLRYVLVDSLEIDSTHARILYNYKKTQNVMILIRKNETCFKRYGILFIHSFIHSFLPSFIHSFIGMCRMPRFLAVLNSFFHSPLLCTLSLHPVPPTSLPSFLTSSCYIILGLPLSLFVSIFILRTLIGNSVPFHSLYMSKPTQSI